MVADGRARTWGARLVAPVAFFVAATVLVLLVQSGLDGTQAGSTQPSPAAPIVPTDAAETAEAGTTEATDEEPATTQEEQTETQPAEEDRQFYTVESGDTLAGIAEQFDTTVPELLELNPDVDPLALTVGERIRVR